MKFVKIFLNERESDETWKEMMIGETLNFIILWNENHQQIYHSKNKISPKGLGGIAGDMFIEHSSDRFYQRDK